MANSGGYPYPSGGGAQTPSNPPASGDTGASRANRGSRTVIRKGRSSKGAAGSWHTRPDGTKVFVAAKAQTTTPGTTASTPAPQAGALSVGRFRTWDPEHQRQFIKFYMNNRTPDEFWSLPLDQRRQLLENARGQSKTAQDPGSTTRVQSLQDIFKAAESAANLKYNPDERDVQDEQRVSGQQQKNITGWFSEYQKQLRDIQASTDAAYSQAQGSVQGLGDRTATLDANQQAQLQAAMQADAAMRGATVDPSIAATASQAAANRKTDLDSIGSVIAGQRANNVRFQGENQRLGAQQAITEHMKEGNVAKNLLRKLAQVRSDKGDFEGTTRQTLIDNERKYGLDKATLESSILGKSLDAQQTEDKVITSGAFAGMTNAQVAALSDDEKNKMRSAYKKSGGSNSSTNKVITSGAFAGYTNSQVAGMSEDRKNQLKAEFKNKGGKSKTGKPSTGPGSVTPATEQKTVSQIERVRSLIATPPRWPDGPRKGQKMTRQDVINSLKQGGSLSRGKPLDPRVVDVAGNLVENKGKLGPYGVKQAHALGVHINNRWGTTTP